VTQGACSLAWGGALAVALIASSACSGGDARLKRSSRQLAKAIDAGDEDALEASVLAGQRGRLDRERLLRADGRQELADELAEPIAIEGWARMRMGEGEVIDVRATEGGRWSFASDPTDFYGQSTPRETLRSFVRASRLGRWDVLLRLAPRRYRMGLSEDDLRHAWTDGEEAALLAERRDRLAQSLDRAIRADAHQAIMAIGNRQFARLERERDRWVVVDF
jgi:hypothetical protein